MSKTIIISINQLVPSVLYIGRLDIFLNFNLGRNPQKISHERPAYESVDEKSLS